MIRPDLYMVIWEYVKPYVMPAAEWITSAFASFGQWLVNLL